MGTEGDCYSYVIDGYYQTGSNLTLVFGSVDGATEFVNDHRFCDDDEAYWLIGAKPNALSNLCGDTSCDSWSLVFSELAGYNVMKEGTQSGGLSLDGVVRNAIDSWKANGKVNGWNGGSLAPNFADPEEVEKWIAGDLSTTRGIVDIPVCSFQEMSDTVVNDMFNSYGNPNYPCPRNNPFCECLR